MKDRLRQLEIEHSEALCNNDWRDCEETKKLELEYKKIQDYVKEYCIECNNLSTIHCQYH
jgi:hypothetical protein